MHPKTPKFRYNANACKLLKNRLTSSSRSVNLFIGTCTKKVLKTKKNKLHHQKRLSQGPFLFCITTRTSHSHATSA
jgi:hypothetical protein